MIIKKFQANTETDAILLAKEELGKDAIVMNIKTIKPKGIYKFLKKPTVEITAAVDDNTTYSGEQLLNKIQEMKDLRQTEEKKEKQEKQIFKDILFEEEEEMEEASAIEKKLNSLQDMLEQQMYISQRSKEVQKEVSEEPEELDKNAECVKLIYEKLIHNEVDEKYAKQIISEIEGTIKKDASVDNILASIYQKIILKLGQPQPITLNEGETKFVFFIGPTGVGKTTTIAKIASSFKVHKKAKVALLTSDTYRVAAVEQLRTYANILGTPLKVVYSADEIKMAEEEFKDYDIVLIDTAGRSHKNKEQREDVKELIDSIDESEREIFLVLSATTKYNDLVNITETYQEITDYKVIFTKLDETSTIGNIFNIKMLTEASLSYATWGQNVPDDIGRIDTQNIAKKLLGGQ